MTRLPVASLALCALASACSSSGGGGGGTPTPTPTPTPTITVTVLDGKGAPQAGATVLVESSAGTLLQTLTTDSSGTARPTIAAGQMVSVGRMDAVTGMNWLQTVTQVKPGDQLILGATPVPRTGTLGSMTFNGPGTFSGATNYEVVLSCTGQSNTTPTFTLPIPAACATATGTFDAVAHAYTGTTVLASSTLSSVPFASGGTVTFPAWQAAPTFTSTLTQTPIGSLAVYFTISLQGSTGSLQSPNNTASRVVTAGTNETFSLVGAAPTAGIHGLRVVELALAPLAVTTCPVARDSELIVEDATAGPTDANLSSDLLPPITAVTADAYNGTARPTVFVATTAAAAGLATVVDGVWAGGAHRLHWTVWGPAGTPGFRFPEAPAPFSILVTDTAGISTAITVDSSALSGYDAFRQKLSPVPPFIAPADGRQRISMVSGC